jgi:hypothetical protein
MNARARFSMGLPPGRRIVTLGHTGELHPRVRRSNFQRDDFRSLTEPILELAAETFQSSLPRRPFGAETEQISPRPIPVARHRFNDDSNLHGSPPFPSA